MADETVHQPEQTCAAHFILSTHQAFTHVAHPDALFVCLIARGFIYSGKLAHHKCKQCGTGTLENTCED